MDNIKFFELIISQGIFAVLFIWLLIDHKKDSKEREGKYQKIILELSTSKEDLKEMKIDIKDIKQHISKT